jgi:hypothetical protein
MVQTKAYTRREPKSHQGFCRAERRAAKTVSCSGMRNTLGFEADAFDLDRARRDAEERL